MIVDGLPDWLALGFMRAHERDNRKRDGRFTMDSYYDVNNNFHGINLGYFLRYYGGWKGYSMRYDVRMFVFQLVWDGNFCGSAGNSCPKSYSWAKSWVG